MTIPASPSAIPIASRQPLLGHDGPDAIVAWRRGVPVTVRRFLGDVAALAARLPPGGHVLNACADRYRFTVGLVATLASGKLSLLPPNLAPETVRRMRDFRADVFCLADRDDLVVDLPCIRYGDGGDDRDCGAIAPPEVALDDTALWLFTSGSTGEPVAHGKRWGSLLRSVAIEADRLGLRRGGDVIVATVPPQHSYGLESTVLLPLHTGNAFDGSHPLYPADVAATLAAVPPRRLLVSTPFHLRLLLDAGIELPALDAVVSATAPLTPAMARDVERRFATRMVEIYGSTDTGQIASRQPTLCAEWSLFDGVVLTPEEERTWVAGGHVGEAIALCDVVELGAAGRFVLLGRSADVVKVAGKRSSLAHLTHQLNSVPGVVDGAYVVPEDDDARRVPRLAAIVVAPEVAPADVLRELRLRIDPAFLPRPLVFVDELPRNSTGKLPRAALRRLLADRSNSAAERE